MAREREKGASTDLNLRRIEMIAQTISQDQRQRRTSRSKCLLDLGILFFFLLTLRLPVRIFLRLPMMQQDLPRPTINRIKVIDRRPSYSVN
ncbi:uncharacterized protein BO95DRAFT_247027 [Aspergillus brunneoviolaceus CBS 621.78]|uniref:Uncharacterized protein n=1 Tax=Aspergillus brunneoviolaceus CBS 621.78 TaxID=1450534 RepID=A0ACD1GKP6_9EURO|nr:hypothetical protein BO95DRAFT_247027 [Aspergillus brunneoviolaceus CBS 621.78]RAH49841.1 hypothetical protein BO95DRAFT_247027 [Aspergillus brunneoviolaceus CBS 621.78]